MCDKQEDCTIYENKNKKQKQKQIEDILHNDDYIIVKKYLTRYIT